MGINTIIMIHNDGLHLIKDDPKFGEKVYYAVVGYRHNQQNDISVGHFVNCCKVVAQNHANVPAVIVMGGNTAVELTQESLGLRGQSENEDQQKRRQRIANWQLDVLKRGLRWLGIQVRFSKELKEAGGLTP